MDTAISTGMKKDTLLLGNVYETVKKLGEDLKKSLGNT